jgi:endonuclease YncB( thermonuclease family)
MRTNWKHMGFGIALATLLLTTPAFAQPLQLCGNQRNTPTKTCVVDGDTLWLQGEKIRLKDFDTPETQGNLCGGRSEVELGKQAAVRLTELLNRNRWTIERFGKDRYRRPLATIRIGGVDVGDILISERLARSWRNGEKWWCTR